jgi:hypothetical protein
MTLQVFWNKCLPDAWCPLATVNLEHSHFDSMDGVYIIWHGGNSPRTVYIGTGRIRDRLRAHRIEPGGVQTYSSLGLFVTWAAVVSDRQAGVAHYLADQFAPLLPLQRPDVPPEEVNKPF